MKTSIPLVLLTFALICFGLLPKAQAVVPPPDGGYPNFTTTEGDHALQALTLGVGNTAIGTFSLFSVTTGNFNTAVGAGSLDLNQADSNTAVGAAALLFNTTGTENTANGTAALEFNNTSDRNTANGAFALFNNTTGVANTAVGAEALFNNVDGSANTVVGAGAGPNLAAGFNNTYVGQFVGDNSGAPIPDEDLTIRIADFSVDGFGSAACYIGGIFNNLQPVNGTTVVQVTLDLTNDHLGYDFGPARGGSAPAAPQRNAPQPRVRPQPGNRQAMLNEFLKRQKKVEEQQASIAELKSTVAQQQKQIEALAAGLQKVSAQLEVTKPAPQTVLNNQ